MAHPDLELIRRALAREPKACRTLVDRLTPAIQRQVNAALIRRRRGSRQDVLDLTQEIFRILLENDGRLLRDWDPAKGARLEGWVGLIAERRAINILASGRKSGFAEDPREPGDFDLAAASGPTPELSAISKDELAKLVEALKANLSDQGFMMFRLLFVEQRDVAWFEEKHGMKRDAVYAWRSRIRKALMKSLQEIESDPARPPGRHLRGAS